MQSLPASSLRVGEDTARGFMAQQQKCRCKGQCLRNRQGLKRADEAQQFLEEQRQPRRQQQ
jgi:hypothetical protein